MSLRNTLPAEEQILAEPPDDGPLLHSDDMPPPHFEIVNLGEGPVAVINTSANDDPYRPGD